MAQINDAARGKTVAYVTTDGATLGLHFTDGTQLDVGLFDEDSGTQLKGKFVARAMGVHIIARTARPIAHRREVGVG